MSTLNYERISLDEDEELCLTGVVHSDDLDLADSLDVFYKAVLDEENDAMELTRKTSSHGLSHEGPESLLFGLSVMSGTFRDDEASVLYQILKSYRNVVDARNDPVSERDFIDSMTPRGGVVYLQTRHK